MLMESTDSSSGLQQPNLPPGFRFHPTDEELVVHYLKKKASSSPLPVAIIAEVDLYKFDPWELPAKASFGEQEWYFFSPRDRKYPNGARPNRAATSGYWKATGTDKQVLTSGGTQKVGVKKALVFYGGKPPKGIKTNWIMHEYRLTDNKANNNKPPGCDLGNKKNSLRLDDWVLCRIYKKSNTHRPMDHDRDDSLNEMLRMVPPSMTTGGQHGGKLGFQSKATTSFASFPENDPNLYDGMVNTSEGINNGLISISISNHHHHHLPTTQSLKRTSPVPVSVPSLYWTDDVDPRSSKRFHGDNTNETIERTERDGYITTMPSNMPEITSFQQRTILGSTGDGVFRPNYNQVSGFNWYS